VTAASVFREHAAAGQCRALIVARDREADRRAEQRDADESVRADRDVRQQLAALEPRERGPSATSARYG